MKLGDEVRSKGKGGQADRTFLSCGAEEGERGGGWEGRGVPWGAFVVSLKLTLELARGTISLKNHLFICFSLRKILPFHKHGGVNDNRVQKHNIFFLPGEKKHGEGGAKVGGGHVDPHVQGEGLDEGEEVWRGRRRLLVQDPNS